MGDAPMDEPSRVTLQEDNYPQGNGLYLRQNRRTSEFSIIKTALVRCYVFSKEVLSKVDFMVTLTI